MNIPKGNPIAAKLVAAIVPRPSAVTGFSAGAKAGAKSTHLAVPAGSVYYFEAANPEQAAKLADALNWHGSMANGEKAAAVLNRRSTLFGEKGFGMGLCSSWKPFESAS